MVDIVLYKEKPTHTYIYIYIQVTNHMSSPMQENAYGVQNKAVMDGTLVFIQALQSASTSPLAMIKDTTIVCNLFKAETANMDELQSSLATLEQLSKVTDQQLG